MIKQTQTVEQWIEGVKANVWDAVVNGEAEREQDVLEMLGELEDGCDEQDFDYMAHVVLTWYQSGMKTQPARPEPKAELKHTAARKRKGKGAPSLNGHEAALKAWATRRAKAAAKNEARCEAAAS